MKKGKKTIIALIVIVLIIPFIPIRIGYKDGGSTALKSLVYEIIDYHKLTNIYGSYEVGTGVEIFGKEIYKNTQIISETEFTDVEYEGTVSLYTEVYNQEGNYVIELTTSQGEITAAITTSTITNIPDNASIEVGDTVRIKGIKEIGSTYIEVKELECFKSELEKLKAEYGIDDTYRESVDEDFNGYTEYCYTKFDKNGIGNPYDSLKVTIDNSTGKVFAKKRFNNSAFIEAEIDEKTAKGKAVAAHSKASVEKSVLEYYMPEYPKGDVLLAYRVEFKDGNVIFVNAVSGDIVGTDQNK